MQNNAFIYLASQSPRRSEILTQMGVQHQVLLPKNKEEAEALETPWDKEHPRDYVQRVTALKLKVAVRVAQEQLLPFAPILCADTTVALGRSILGKPQDDSHAKAMLRRLAGRGHTVYTAVALARPSNGEWTIVCALSTSRVYFAALGEDWLNHYIATGEAFGKAGAYGIQGLAATKIERIHGSYSGIMGLPIYETACLLKNS